MTYAFDPFAFSSYGGNKPVPITLVPASLVMGDQAAFVMDLSDRPAFTLVMSDRA